MKHKPFEVIDLDAGETITPEQLEAARNRWANRCQETKEQVRETEAKLKAATEAIRFPEVKSIVPIMFVMLLFVSGNPRPDPNPSPAPPNPSPIPGQPRRDF